MKVLGLLLLTIGFIQGQQSSNRYTVIAAGDTTVVDNRNTACTSWVMTITSGGFSGETVTLQSSPDNITWSTFVGTTVSGSNPSTATTFATYLVTGYVPYARIDISGLSGAGTINLALNCWRSPNYVAKSSGFLGGNSSGNTIAGGATSYLGLGNTSPSTTQNQRYYIIPRPGVIRNLYFNTTSSQPSGGGLTCCLTQNSATPSSLCATVPTSGGAQTVSDLNQAHAITVAAGDLVSTQCVNASGSTSANIGAWSVEFD